MSDRISVRLHGLHDALQAYCETSGEKPGSVCRAALSQFLEQPLPADRRTVGVENNGPQVRQRSRKQALQRKLNTKRKLLTTSEIAARWNTTNNVVLDRIDRKMLVAHNVAKRDRLPIYLIFESDLKKFEKQHGRPVARCSTR